MCHNDIVSVAEAALPNATERERRYSREMSGAAGSSNGVSSRHRRPLMPPATSPPSRVPAPVPTTSAASLGGLGPHKIRVTLLCARSLAKRDLFRMPDPFVRLTVDGTAQSYCTDTVRNCLDPKWNSYFDLLLRPADTITISVWNEKKVNKANATSKKASNSSTSSGFLGCVRLLPNAIERLKDTGYQRLDLVSDNNNPLPVKGQIVISLMCRDGQGTGKKHLRPHISLIPSSLVKFMKLKPPSFQGV